MIKSAKRPWMIRLSYSMPLINGIIFLILGFLPHLFYISGNNNPPTLSPFGLLDIVHANGLEYLSATASGTTEDFYFYMIMLAFWAVCTLCIALYAIFATWTTVMLVSVWTPQDHPTIKGNKFKRAYRIFVPNRGFFVFYQILPIVPAIFPHLFQLFCKNMLGQTMKVYYYGIPDWIVVSILTVVAITLFFASLSAQKEHKMDLFRIYKIEKQQGEKTS